MNSNRELLGVPAYVCVSADWLAEVIVSCLKHEVIVTDLNCFYASSH